MSTGVCPVHWAQASSRPAWEEKHDAAHGPSRSRPGVEQCSARRRSRRSHRHTAVSAPPPCEAARLRTPRLSRRRSHPLQPRYRRLRAHEAGARQPRVDRGARPVDGAGCRATSDHPACRAAARCGALRLLPYDGRSRTGLDTGAPRGDGFTVPGSGADSGGARQSGPGSHGARCPAHPGPVKAPATGLDYGVTGPGQGRLSPARRFLLRSSVRSGGRGSAAGGAHAGQARRGAAGSRRLGKGPQRAGVPPVLQVSDVQERLLAPRRAGRIGRLPCARGAGGIRRARGAG